MTHEHTLEVTGIASGLPTVQKSNKERCVEKHRRAQAASSEHGLLQKSTQETLRQKKKTVHLPPPDKTKKRCFKVHGRLKPDERHTADTDKSMSSSLRLQLPTATYISDRTPLRLQPEKHAEKQNKRTQSECINTHRKQTGPLTSTGVPSPPLSHGVSSPGSGGLPTAADSSS